MNSGYAPTDFVIAAIAVVIIPGLSAWGGKSLARASTDGRRLVGRYWWVIVRSVAVILLVIGAWLRLGRSFPVLGLDVPVGRWGRAGFGVDAVIAAYYLYAVLLRKRSATELDAVRERLRRMHSDRMLPQTREEFALFPVVAIVGSVSEELLYRGFLIAFFAPITGAVGAVLLSSVAFSLGHAYLGWIGMLRTAGIGAVFGFAFVATRSLWWLMLAHVIVNSFGAPLQRRLRRDATTQPA